MLHASQRAAPGRVLAGSECPNSKVTDSHFMVETHAAIETRQVVWKFRAIMLQQTPQPCRL